MVTVYIDNISISARPGSTVLQACDSAGIKIPRFCFHERLLVAGNCRICLVEVEKAPKPVAACAMPVHNGIRVFTKSPLANKARESVLEFMLVNHPLDCPVCDQGGECDLQEQSFFFGSERSRFFYFKKRSVFNKNWGPLINTIINRCINCTRCVRFISEVVGFSDLGSVGRGVQSEIGFFVKASSATFFSGNVIDLCPVGLFTNKIYT